MIYFIQAEAGGPIKIGTSEVMSNRVAQHAAKLGKPVAVLGVIDGGQVEEVAMHRRFAHLRIGRGRNEWFESGPDLVAFIEEATRPWDGSSDRGLGTPEPKQSVASFRGSAAFAAWFEGLLTHARMPASVLIEHALIDFAAKVGYKEKPPER